MNYEADRVGRALKAQLENELGDALDTVEAAWASVDPLTLPDPVTWFFGHKPTVLEMESSAFPFVAVIVARVTPQDRPSRWGFQQETITAFVDYFVVADDETTVNKMVHRYAEAIRAVLQAERVLGGYQQADYNPDVNVSEASRHPKTTNADMFNADNVDYIQMGRITVNLHGG